MKKVGVFLLCIWMLLSLFSCGKDIHVAFVPLPDNTKNTVDLVEEEITTELACDELTTENVGDESIAYAPNDRARKAFRAVIRNEVTMYYPLRNVSTPKEIYFNHLYIAKTGVATGLAMVDMDRDGINELILEFGCNGDLVVLHFENDRVYGFDVDRDAMDTIFTDGSFSWTNDSDFFGDERGISRLSFIDGSPKYQELCRVEEDARYYLNGLRVTNEQYPDYYYLNGLQVTEEQFQNYIENNCRTPVVFTPFDLSLLDPDGEKALALASAYWGIKNGEFDSERGYRYRVCLQEDISPCFKVSLYCFVGNSYYEYLALATVNIETGEISVQEYPEGMG